MTDPLLFVSDNSCRFARIEIESSVLYLKQLLTVFGNRHMKGCCYEET